MTLSDTDKQASGAAASAALKKALPASWSERLQQRLLAVKVADLCDGLHELGIPVRLAGDRLRPVIPFSQVAGPAITVRTFLGAGKRDYNEQMVSVYDLGRLCHAPVMVLRCEVPGFVNMGGGGAQIARVYGYSGIVMDGPARDTAELRALEFGIFSTGVCPDSILIDEVPEGQSIHFEIGGAVEIGGQLIQPGQIVVGDNDGLIVLAAEEVEPALRAAEKIVQAEADFAADLKEAVPPVELLARLRAEQKSGGLADD